MTSKPRQHGLSGRTTGCRFSCLSLLLLGTMGAVAAELTPIQTSSFPTIGQTSGWVDFTGIPADNIILETESALSGFTKFDPSLGVLTEVRFSVGIDASLFIQIVSDGFIDENDPFSFVLQAGPLTAATSDLVYRPSGTIHEVSTASESVVPNSLGLENQIVADYTFEDVFAFESQTIKEYGGFIDGGTIETQGSLDATPTAFTLSDLEGVGAVTGLSVRTRAVVENLGIRDNLSDARIDANIELKGGDVSLCYIYVPAYQAPKILDYQQSGTTYTLTFQGSPGASGWIVEGSETLLSFPDDLSTQAIVTETSPGSFTAVLELPALSASAYFFRVREP